MEVSSGFFSSFQNPQEKELLLLHRVTHHALGWWRGGLGERLHLGKQLSRCSGRQTAAKRWVFLLSELRTRVSGTGKGMT